MPIFSRSTGAAALHLSLRLNIRPRMQALVIRGERPLTACGPSPFHPKKVTAHLDPATSMCCGSLVMPKQATSPYCPAFAPKILAFQAAGAPIARTRSSLTRAAAVGAQGSRPLLRQYVADRQRPPYLVDASGVLVRHGALAPTGSSTAMTGWSLYGDPHHWQGNEFVSCGGTSRKILPGWCNRRRLTRSAAALIGFFIRRAKAPRWPSRTLDAKRCALASTSLRSVSVPHDRPRITISGRQLAVIISVWLRDLPKWVWGEERVMPS
jgi:hypothetical protein